MKPGLPQQSSGQDRALSHSCRGVPSPPKPPSLAFLFAHFCMAPPCAESRMCRRSCCPAGAHQIESQPLLVRECASAHVRVRACVRVHAGVHGLVAEWSSEQPSTREESDQGIEISNPHTEDRLQCEIVRIKTFVFKTRMNGQQDSEQSEEFAKLLNE